MSVAAAVARVAAISASTPVVLPTLVTLPAVVAITTAPRPPASDPPRSPTRRRRVRREAVRYAADRQREARIYSWASRSFLSTDPSSDRVALNRHGNSIYGNIFNNHQCTRCRVVSRL